MQFKPFVAVAVLVASPVFAQTSQKPKPKFDSGMYCLDRMIGVTEGDRFAYNALGGGCKVLTPIPPLPRADMDLLERMEIQVFNIMNTNLVIQSGGNNREEEKTLNALILETEKSFRKNRQDFCSRHPEMYVYDLDGRGSTTPPVPCKPVPTGYYRTLSSDNAINDIPQGCFDNARKMDPELVIIGNGGGTPKECVKQ